MNILNAVAGVASLAFAMLLAVSVRVTNPELTEVQLLLEHWRAWILVALFGVAGALFLKDIERKKQ